MPSLVGSEMCIRDRPYLQKNLTLAQLKQYDVGCLNPCNSYASFFPDQLALDKVPEPTLREMIKYVSKASNEQVGFQIEMKTNPEHDEWTYSPKEFTAALYKVNQGSRNY
eukprot:TRINITY_DN823_c0_g1_i2.p3 TRINITY_DN823_c0_g1~~TRINITY_DN823_c0_g1_i2.p3  ORF type:complete len:110 (-),score=8.32 TRINITY_DN823_c0_g1_i2:352-681(-)